jgi:Flp pilus assembly CpaE family ATPase
MVGDGGRPDVGDTAAGASPRSLVIAVTGGPAGPGRTTVAVGLGAALGVAAPTVLVDADPWGPSIAAALDADPTRNLAMLAFGLGPSWVGGGAWDRVLAGELQPLHSACPQGWTLCGAPAPEARPVLPAAFFERLLAELRPRFRYVVLDAGGDLLATESVASRAAVAGAGRVLVVAGADIVGLVHARRALEVLRGPLAVPDARLGLVLNHFHWRFHHAPAEVEEALRVPVVAVLPHDFPGVQRALAAQRPVVFGGPGGGASRVGIGGALLELASRLHGGQIAVPRAGAVRGQAARSGPPAAPLRRACGRALGAGVRGERRASRRPGLAGGAGR